MKRSDPVIQVGQKFGNWKVVSTEVRREGGYRYIQVDSGAGPEWKLYDNLRSGKSGKSSKSKRAAHTALDRGKCYGRWYAMQQRCTNPADPQYKNYGARGIKVAPEFDQFEDYYEFISALPKTADASHIDRTDNNGNYQPGNIRWCTPSTNARNMSTTVMVEVDGVRMALIDAVERFTYLTYSYARQRFKKGATVEDLARTPPGFKSPLYSKFKSGELQPKHPYSHMGWL